MAWRVRRWGDFPLTPLNNPPQYQLKTRTWLGLAFQIDNHKNLKTAPSKSYEWCDGK